MPEKPQIGVVNGLAVYGPNMGALLEIEVSAVPVEKGQGTYNITGVVDEEELGGGSRKLRRKSMAKGSIENVLTVLEAMGFSPKDYNLHINFPGEPRLTARPPVLLWQRRSYRRLRELRSIIKLR